MHLRALTLHNFRLFEHALFQFSPGINLICGGNARGKTTVIEAIFFLITGRSFRSSHSSALIRHGASYFYIEALFEKFGIEQQLRVYCNGKERKITYNSTQVNGLALLGLLQGSVMHPDDIAIIKGAPALRRQILNLQLAQSDPLYVHYLMRYDQAMRQRNSLLRAQRVDAIESWEYEMGNAAAYIIQKRTQLVGYLQELGKEYYTFICGGKEELSFHYKAHGAPDQPKNELSTLRQLFCDQYKKHRKREMALGMTLTGPHRDDLCVSIGRQEARSFASEGQQRSCVAALRLAEWMQLKESSTEAPLMLVDDFGLSLDVCRRKALMQHFEKLGQVFISTTEQQSLSERAHLMKI